MQANIVKSFVAMTALCTALAVQSGPTSAQEELVIGLALTVEVAPNGPTFVDLNTASMRELTKIVGARGATLIVRGRPYHSIQDFVTRGVLPRKTYSVISDKIIVLPKTAGPAKDVR